MPLFPVVGIVSLSVGRGTRWHKRCSRHEVALRNTPGLLDSPGDSRGAIDTAVSLGKVGRFEGAVPNRGRIARGGSNLTWGREGTTASMSKSYRILLFVNLFSFGMMFPVLDTNTMRATSAFLSLTCVASGSHRTTARAMGDDGN